MIVEDQGEVLEFLSRPEAFGRRDWRVERIDTHISSIFLLGERALKLKRAVRYPYLDFSTKELRRRYCEAEVAVNRRTAPAIYKGVLPVVRRPDGSLSVGGEGEVLDWVVDMARFDENGLLDRVALRGGLTPRLMTDLAEAVAVFHGAAEERLDRGGKAGLQGVLAGNAAAFAELPPGILDAGRVKCLIEASVQALEHLGPLLEARRRLGRVRHCHGDLHLRNVCLVEDRPVLFDAIEFNEAFSDIDTFYDLAFLLMDLDHRRLRRLASFLMNAYLDASGDGSGLGALPLFLSARAAIRAHVSATAVGTVSDIAEVARLRGEARAYLDAALAYLSPPPPRLVAVGGLSGSGKSRLGRELAPHLGAAPGARVLRTDVIRKRMLGAHPLKKLPKWGYAPDITRQTYQVFYEAARATLKSGHSVVADAVFAGPEQREAIERVASEVGVPFQGLWLEAAPEIMTERVEKRVGNASDADAAVVVMQQDYDLGEISWPRVDSGGAREHTLSQGLDILGLGTKGARVR
jgi:aminoglycoside phosphotransferase family enzyme/predicted kinase